MSKEIELGMFVKDKLSLLEGVVASLLRELNCVDRVEVQPQGDGATHPASWVIDITGVEILDKPKAIEVEIAVPKYALGIEAECAVTGFKGVINGIRLMVNGCIGYVLVEGTQGNVILTGTRSMIRHQVLEPNLLVPEKPVTKVKHNETERGCSNIRVSDYLN